MTFEVPSVPGPESAIECTVRLEAIGSRIGHGEGVMSVVMGEKSLPAKGEQAVKTRQPLVHRVEMRCIAAIIHGIGLPKALGDDPAHSGFHGQIHIGEPAAKSATELLIGRGPAFLSRIAWKLRAKNCQTSGLKTCRIILGFG